MATHVKVIGVLFIVFGAMWIVGAFFSTLVLSTIAGILAAGEDPDARIGVAVLGMTGALLSTFLLAIGIPQIICGWGLLKFKRWARILAIVLGIISLASVPIGTAFGIYVLVIFFNKDTEAILTA
jgi:hypothetical protein